MRLLIAITVLAACIGLCMWRVRENGWDDWVATGIVLGIGIAAAVLVTAGVVYWLVAE